MFPKDKCFITFDTNYVSKHVIIINNPNVLARILKIYIRLNDPHNININFITI